MRLGGRRRRPTAARHARAALSSIVLVLLSSACSSAPPPPLPTPPVRTAVAAPPATPSAAAAPDPRADTDYVALAPRAYLPALARLIEYRRSQGHVPLALAVEEAYARFSDGEPDVRALYGALRELYGVTEGRLRYVLLVGDVWRPGEEEVDRLPTVYLPKLCYNTHDHEVLHYRHEKLLHTPHSHEHHEYPSDHPLAVLDGPLEPGLPPRTGAEAAAFPAGMHEPHDGTDHGHAVGPAAGDVRSWASGRATAGRATAGRPGRHRSLPMPPARGRASVAIGRLPVRDASEIAGFIDKLIAYETAPITTAWPRRLVVVAGPARYGRAIDAAIEATALSVLEHDVPYDYDLSFLFAKPGSAYAYRFDRLGDKLVEEANRGALLLAYVGHSSPAYFDSVRYRGSSYLIGSRPDLLRLNVASGFPLFVSLSCGAGGFDLSHGWLSLAEAAVMNPQGAIASFAASRESHPYANMLYGEALAEQLLRRRPSSIGEAILAVKRELRERTSVVGEALTEVDSDALKEEHASLYNLFGDPATRLRIPAAARLSLSSAEPVVAGAPFEVSIGSPAVAAGQAVVSLETERSVIRDGLVSPAALERLPLERAFAAMADNHAKASDKVLQSVRVPFRQGHGQAALTAPAEAGRYVVKAFVQAADAAEPAVAMGHLRVDVVPGER